METKLLTELQAKNMEAAAQLAQLAIDDSVAIQKLLSDLALQLVRESIASARALNQAKSLSEIASLRAEYVRRMATLMIDGAKRLADAGNETRSRFSRLLTERLASGSHDLLDAFQSFFKVLPSQKADAIEMMQAAIDRSSAAFEHIASVSAAAVRARPLRRRSTMAKRPPAASANPLSTHAA